jgi:mannose-6-phosphate isomerase
MLRLQCEVKNYKWGQPGSTSLVADLVSHGEGNIAIDANEPYAELWMGSHVSGPSVSAKTGEGLDQWLKRNRMALGGEILLQHGASLPFLFKVLSIQKALSIQSHPDKGLAERLHAERPHVYKDPNHKPEIALAVRFDIPGTSNFTPNTPIAAALHRC